MLRSPCLSSKYSIIWWAERHTCWLILLNLDFQQGKDQGKDLDKRISTLSTLGKIFSRRHTEIVLFLPETCFDISCKFAWNAKTCFPGKIRKNIVNLSSPQLSKRVVKVKQTRLMFGVYFILGLTVPNLIRINIIYELGSLLKIRYVNLIMHALNLKD